MNRARVESFTSSPDALAAFSASSGYFDLVVTDRDMPALDGLDYWPDFCALARPA